MMPAVKHGDPQLGVDIHLCVVPPSPSPVPLPTPHMSVVFDPMDYLPFIGATVTVCGMKRGVAGTAGTAVHIPPGFPFAPKLPDKDDEIFMGSATVVADGDPFSFLGVPVLACQVVGMPSPPRPRRKGGPRVMMLPTVFNLAIPTNVFVGGPPTISLMGMAFKLGFAGLGRLAKSRFAKAVGARFRAWRKAKFGHLKPSFLKCKILRAEPVNIVTGAVSVEQEDFTLPGMIPVNWTRRYASDNPRPGACGVGWETPADARLEHDPESGVVLFHHPAGDIAIFPAAPHEPGAAAAVLELMDGALLSDEGEEFRVRTKEDRIYRFRKAHAAAAADGSREYPLDVIEDLCGNTLFYERDAQRRLIAIRERAGRCIEIEHGTAGFIRRVSLHVPETGFRHVFVEYEQTQAGDLTEVRDALGQPYRFAYDAHHMVRHTDRNGLSFYYEYDKAAGNWRVVRSWGDGGLHAYKFAYLDAAQERRITDSLGHVSVVTLDERGLPISEIDPLGGKTVFEYDEAGRTTAVVDPDGHRTEYRYDSSGNLIGLIRPDGCRIEVEYTVANKPVRIVQPNGAVWQQNSDNRGLLTAQTTPLGHVWRYEYDAFGNMRRCINPRGGRIEYQFDELGNLTSITDAKGNSTWFTYDVFGQVSVKADALGHKTGYHYDAKGRLTKARLPSAVDVECRYDAEDNLVSYVDENHLETRFEHTGQGCVSRQIQADGATIEFQYDTEERLAGVRNQLGQLYKLKRDELGRVVEEIDYWGQSRQFQYSASGLCTQSIDALGRTTSYRSNALGQVVERLTSDVHSIGAVVEETFEYDPNCNLSRYRGPDAHIEREFDLEGRMLEERQGAHFLSKSTFDGVGNRVSHNINLTFGAVSFGRKVQFDYNLLNEVTRIGRDDVDLVQLERDQVGQVTGERLGDQLLRVTEHDADGRITSRTTSRGDRTLEEVSFAYDSGGNLLRRQEQGRGSDSFAYDRAGHIVRHINTNDEVHHRIVHPDGSHLAALHEGRGAVQSSPEHGGSRRAQCGDNLYRFDAAGNMTERRRPSDVLSLTWDANQRLIQSRTNDLVTDYRYDPQGRRIRKSNEERQCFFFWDGNALACEVVADSTGSVQSVRDWIYYPRTVEPVAVGELSGKPSSRGTLLFFNNEPNGCPSRLIDPEGRTRWGASYNSSGAIENLYASEVDNPIRLVGQYADSETGLHYNRYRYYDPISGQFISLDPLRLAAGTNCYAYGPNIFAWMDPLGLTCVYRFHTHADPSTLLPNITRASFLRQKWVGFLMHFKWYREWRAHLHMRGDTRFSPFVSVVTDPAALANSTDPWAKTITTGSPGLPGVHRAPDLSTFDVPPDKLIGPRPDNVLSQAETEVVTWGNDLGSLATNTTPNPY